jgi:predicted phage terminase large subunit-like protein
MVSTIVDQSVADAITAEAVLRAKARKRSQERVFDRDLGATFEEAQEKIRPMREDVGAYGEYVHGHVPARHHRFWIDLYHRLIDGELVGPDGHVKRKLLLIAPPGSAKSTWTSIEFVSWYLGTYPDHSVMFFTSSDPMAHQFGTTIRTTLESNERHRYVFPETAARPNKVRGWSGDGLYLMGTPSGSKDPAYRALGWNASIMGGRCHGLIIDDPMNQEDAQSEIEQRKAKAYYDMTVSERPHPDAWIIGIMTRWHENDLASHFIRLAKAGGDWHVVVLPQIAREDDPLGRRPGQPLWPERRGLAAIETRRREMGVAQFNAVHQGDPTGLGGDVFESEQWFKPLPPNFHEIKNKLLIVQGWDTAFSERETAAYSACTTIGIDEQFNEYLLNVYRARLTPFELEAKVIEQAEAWAPRAVGIEEPAFKHTVTRMMARRIMERAWVNIQTVIVTKDKVARARTQAARAQAGKVYADKDAHWWPDFISECLGYPNTSYLDQVDSWGIAEEMVAVLEGQRRRKPRPVVIGDR